MTFFSFEQAKDMLANNNLTAPVYYILGGAKSGEVAFFILNKYQRILIYLS